tara:strand:- start:43106 stop:44416 length:1311 start_codon:yes stop_codon:yes gene_type:complete
MAERTFKLPDIGEGIAEAELGGWMVKVGDLAKEDDIICEVTTDKATVEIPAPFSGKVLWIAGEPGEIIAIGGDLIRIETDHVTAADGAPQDPPATEEAQVDAKQAPAERPQPAAAPAPDAAPAPVAAPQARRPEPHRTQALGPTGKPLAAPSVRGRARQMGIDLRQLRGSGPAGRILHDDLEAFVALGPDTGRSGGRTERTGTEEVRLTGIRRTIADRMAMSKSRIPHFSIIEEVDVESLEGLRSALNQKFAEERGKLTMLPFIVQAVARAIETHPEINALFDDEAGIVTRHAALHCGIATQTETGLMVPVLRHAEARSLWKNAREIRRLSEAARDRRITPAELRGSTLTITSLGPLGALATTPVINHPEVAIVGINKISIRPVWDGAAFQPRKMMNLSCSFDHRVVDGWNAAEFMATLKSLLETPAMLFMEWQDD